MYNIMVNYTCYRCGYSNNNKSNIIRHIGRKNTCKSIFNNINLDECKESILNGLNYNEYLENIKLKKSSLNLGESSVNFGKSSVNFGKSSVNFVKNIDYDNSSVESSEDSFEIKTDNKNNLICQYCNKNFARKDYLENHLKKSCKMLKEFNNIYDYDEKTFGKNIYKDYENAGDIYIIQTDYINGDHFKIGITNNIRKRMEFYRCDNTYEPRLHYYISCKDIKLIDNKIKIDLAKYNVKREIFKCDVEELKNKIVDIIKKEFKLNKVYVHEPDIKIGDLSECTYCNKCFYTKNDLFDHFNSCENYKDYLSKKKEGKLKCEFCEKIYSRDDSLHRHLKICKEKKRDEEVKESMMELVQLLNKKLDNQSNQIDDFKKELSKRDKELTKRDNQIDELIKKAGINNSHNTVNVQNNIKLLSYSDTDRSHLTDNDILKCLKHSNFCIPYLIEKIHFDANKPENHNVYISNLKNKYVMMYDGNKWECKDRDEQITNLIDDNEGIIEYKLEEWLEKGVEYPEMMKKFNRYIQKKDNNKVVNIIKDEIKLLLYNNRSIVSKESSNKAIETN
jgi:hypothetical protein